MPKSRAGGSHPATPGLYSPLLSFCLFAWVGAMVDFAARRWTTLFATSEISIRHPLFDADYSSIGGHCDNTMVTDNTTLIEAKSICDGHYGL